MSERKRPYFNLKDAGAGCPPQSSVVMDLPTDLEVTQRQDRNNLLVSFGVVLVSALAVEVSKNLLLRQDGQQFNVGTRQSIGDFKLEDDINCGVTTGGKELCITDCRPGKGVFKNPECLKDCFEEECIKSLLDDYKEAGGVCPGQVQLYGRAV